MGIEGNSREKKTGTAVKELNQQRKENRKQRMNLPLAKREQKQQKKTKTNRKHGKGYKREKARKTLRVILETKINFQ